VGVHEFGPHNASLVVKTYREGVASKAGHDLVIEVGEWQARFDVGEEPAQASMELSADSRSLHPREGLGGVKPLTDKDRDEIRGNIDSKVLGGGPISFRSTAVEPTASDSGTRISVRGELTMNAQTHPAAFELTAGDGGELTGRASVVQSEWGIKPYRGLMGALRVRDAVEVVFSGRVPAT
jgi:polyisoprenoid-binding protein YceI